MEINWIAIKNPEEQQRIEKWVKSLSPKGTETLELLLKEVREQAAAQVIDAIQNEPWWKTLMADAMSFRMVKGIPSFRLITQA